MNQASLSQHVGEAKAGDSNAWGEVYRELAPMIFRLCRRILPTREDAEDATGEIFLKAQLRLDHYDAERPFQAWLYRVAANHCWDMLRKRRGRREVEADLERSAPESPELDPLGQLLAEQTRRQVRETLGRLDDRARLALMMRYFADFTYDEIAELLGVTSSFVGVLLLRARRRMRRLLTEKEAEP
jgi:RNA polymerase sigma-70 factor (ECF subfamily)